MQPWTRPSRPSTVDTLRRRTALASWTVVVAAASWTVVAALATAGCAAGGSPSGAAGSSAPVDPPAASSGSPDLSRTDLPTGPGTPEQTPSDLQASDQVAGTVTAGGSGPCYTLETDDGKQYALYREAGPQLARGAIVRVWFEPAANDCGPGIQVRIRKVDIVRP
jgi:hypothetical protein